MNLNYVKELEDLKAKKAKLKKIREDQIETAVFNFKLKSFNEYKAYFKNKGFAIDHSSNSEFTKIIASYNKSSIILICENEDLIGTYAAFNISHNIGNNNKYTVLLNIKSSGPRIKIISRPNPKDENAVLLSDIDEIKKEIANLENKIATSDIDLYLHIKELNNQQFSSMNELLISLFE